MNSDYQQPDDGIYLLSHSVGLPPTTMAQTMQAAFMQPWQQTPHEVWNHWLGAIEQFREAAARLLQTSAALVCPQPNVSAGLTKLLYALPKSNQRQTIVLSEHAFPSLAFVFQRAAASGFRVKFIPKDANTNDPQVWRDAFDNQTGIALITQVHSNTGEQLPVGDICREAQAKDILTIVDTAQSVGVLPVTPHEWQADCIVGSCVKWLCGGPGAGFLWLRESLIKTTEPVDVGWFSHADPFEFDIHHFQYADDALRFWGGTPAVAPYVAAAHAIDCLLSVGVDAVRAHNVTLTQSLIDALDERQLRSPRAIAERSGTVIVDLRACHPEAYSRLAERRVRFDERAHGIRLSPHLYNAESDIQETIACLT